MSPPPPVPFNDLRRSVARDLPELTAAATRVLGSGWFVHGPEHGQFEAELAGRVGVAHAVGVASGTDALELALRGVCAGRPGSAVVAANAGGYAAVAAMRAGLSLRFVDVDADTLCLSAGTVESVLPGASAVVVTHLYGRLADVEDLAQLCRSAGVPLVEDCAQAIGARTARGAAGSFGAAGTFSFYPTKNLGALGDGGAVTTDDAELAARLRRLRQYGWSDKYRIVEEGGVNSRLDELQAALLRVRAHRVDEDNAVRRSIITRYAAAAAGGPVRVLPADGPHHSGHLAVCLTESRSSLRAALTDAGVATDVHYPVPDHQQPAFASQYTDVRLPVTEAAAQQVLSLPCFPELTDGELDQVCGVLRSYRGP